MTAAVECGHTMIERYSSEDGAVRLWACVDCHRRFYSACPICVVNGHRDEQHPEEPNPTFAYMDYIQEARVAALEAREPAPSSMTGGVQSEKEPK